MAEILVTGKRISDMELIPTISGDEKIPTGVAGDYAITPEQIAGFVNGKVKAKWGAIEGDIDTQVDLKNKFTGVNNTISAHVNNEDNPHKVTAEQVGLGNVDNTSDIDKPVSTATNTAIQNAVAGKIDAEYVESVLVDKNVKTWSGKTQEEVNKYTADPRDYGAFGYASATYQTATDGTLKNSNSAFDVFEKAHFGKLIDLNGQYYVVDYIRNGCRYYNGSFVVDGLIQKKEYVSTLEKKWSRDCGEGFIYDEFCVEAPYTGGFIQSMSYDMREDCFWGLSVIQNQENTALERSMVHKFVTESRKSAYTAVKTNLSSITGHQGIGTQMVDGVTKLWIGYNKSHPKNSQYVMRTPKPENASDFDENLIESFKVFDLSEGNLNREYHCNPTVSPNGDLLVVAQIDYTQHQNYFKIFDLRSMTDPNVDYSEKYLYKFPATHYHEGGTLPLQSVVTDGSLVYALFGSTLHTYTLEGNLVDIEVLKVGYDRSRGFTGANGHVISVPYYEPESLLFVPINGGLTLGVSIVFGYRNAWASTQVRYNYVYTSIPRQKVTGNKLTHDNSPTITSTNDIDIALPYTKPFLLSVQGETFVEGAYDKSLEVSPSELVLYNKDATNVAGVPSGAILKTTFTGDRNYAQLMSTRGGSARGAMITLYGNNDSTLAKGSVLLSCGILDSNPVYTVAFRSDGLVEFASGMTLATSGKPLEATYTKKVSYTATLFDAYGTGSPEGSVVASVGSTYRRTDGGALTSFYVKESGTGNTGWVAK